MGNENLNKPEIQNAIHEAIQKRAKRVEITQDAVLAELAKVAFSNGTDFAEVIQDGMSVKLKDTADLSDDKKAAVSCIKETKFGIAVESYDKIKALELLGKHLGMFDSKATQEPRESNLLQAITDSAQEDLDTDDLPEV